jgi:ATP-dependent Lon protease
VVFPQAITPLVIGQERSVRLVEDIMRAHRQVAVVAQRRSDAPATTREQLHNVGTASFVHQVLRAADGTLRVVLQGVLRVRLEELVATEPYLIAKLRHAPETEQQGLESEALVRAARGLFARLSGLSSELPAELVAALESLTDPLEVAYQIAAAAPLSAAERQAVLEIDSIPEKLKKLIGLLQHHIAVRELERQLTQQTREQMGKTQREIFLREQLRTIQHELGEEDPQQAEIKELQERLANAGLPEEARKEADRELMRLQQIPPISPEHGMIRTYLDWMAALPWSKLTGGPIDMAQARSVLDQDHYDLEKIKDRILEYLAMRKLRQERHVSDKDKTEREPELREPILCFVGAPGVGKTSLGQSIARTLGRRFVRISLGGIHDEAEIRGHRRTYIGALPGRILQAIRRAETADPVFMLDEVDKLGVGIQGDPSAALLEVLDPAQNNTFVDNYLGVAFDLSRVLFLCTANAVATIPPALLDRMEVLGLAGYTEVEKLHIARRHLLPKLFPAHGLTEGEVSLSDGALRRIIREYTREAGVRNLERSVAAVLRKVARNVSEGGAVPVKVEAEDLPSYLGPPRFFNELAERIDRPGIATGLAWTPTGGQILFVEAAMMQSQEERLVLTGMLGDVMRESAQAALSYVRSHAGPLGFSPTVFEGATVHIHVPSGAIPKDGPSAGLAILTALVSLAIGRPVRNDSAMTGEISLRGRVLPVGGIKEKLIAAHLAGVKRVVFPKRNEGDLEDVPAEVRRDLQLVAVDQVEEALADAIAPAAPQRPEPPRLEPPILH